MIIYKDLGNLALYWSLEKNEEKVLVRHFWGLSGGNWVCWVRIWA